MALTFLANDHAVFDADRAKLVRWAGIGQNLLWDSFKGGMTTNCDDMGTCREVVVLFYIGVNPR
jgi:hypothetical protein